MIGYTTLASPVNILQLNLDKIISLTFKRRLGGTICHSLFKEIIFCNLDQAQKSSTSLVILGRQYGSSYSTALLEISDVYQMLVSAFWRYWQQHTNMNPHHPEWCMNAFVYKCIAKLMHYLHLNKCIFESVNFLHLCICALLD